MGISECNVLWLVRGDWRIPKRHERRVSAFQKVGSNASAGDPLKKLGYGNKASTYQRWMHAEIESLGMFKPDKVYRCLGPRDISNFSIKISITSIIKQKIKNRIQTKLLKTGREQQNNNTTPINSRHRRL